MHREGEGGRGREREIGESFGPYVSVTKEQDHKLTRCKRKVTSEGSEQEDHGASRFPEKRGKN